MGRKSKRRRQRQRAGYLSDSVIDRLFRLDGPAQEDTTDDQPNLLNEPNPGCVCGRKFFIVGAVRCTCGRQLPTAVTRQSRPNQQHDHPWRKRNMRIRYSFEAAEKCRVWSANARVPLADGTMSPNAELVEVPWMQEVELRGTPTEPVFYITDVHLFESSEVTGGNWDVTDEHINKFNIDWIKAGKDLKRLRGLGHSHANMGVFQSGTDREYVVKLFDRKAFCVACTWNAKGEVYGEVTLFQPFFRRFESIPVDLEYPRMEVDLAPLHASLKRRVYAGKSKFDDSEWDESGYYPGYRSGYNHGYGHHGRGGDNGGNGYVNSPVKITMDKYEELNTLSNVKLLPTTVTYTIGKDTLVTLTRDVWRVRMLARYDDMYLTTRTGPRKKPTIIRYMVRGGAVFVGVPVEKNGVPITQYSVIKRKEMADAVLVAYMLKFGAGDMKEAQKRDRLAHPVENPLEMSDVEAAQKDNLPVNPTEMPMM